jgi:sugar phosphate isomerase/epimerase
MPDYSKEDIRIGTLVNGLQSSPGKYIKEILPHGFESFQITFWKTTDGIDFQKLADEVNEALDGSGAVISALAIFGNPLENEELDHQPLEGFERLD